MNWRLPGFIMTAEGHLLSSQRVFAKNAELTPVLAHGDTGGIHIIPPSAILTRLPPDIDLHPKSFLVSA